MFKVKTAQTQTAVVVISVASKVWGGSDPRILVTSFEGSPGL